MLKRIPIAAIMLMVWPLSSQIIYECPEPQTVVFASTCEDACVVCDLDGYTGSNNVAGFGEAPPGFCAGTLHNTQWIGFVAGSEDVTLEIDVYNCEFDQNNDGIFEGLQIGIYQTSDCNNFVSSFNCEDQIFGNTTGVFTNTTPLTVGGIYFLVLDGAFSDVCTFTIRVTNGSTLAPVIAQIIPTIVAETQICQGGILDVMVDPPVFGAGAYYWTLDGEAVGTDRSVSIPFPAQPGVYELCVDPYNPCSDGLQACKTVEVIPNVIETITETICEGDFYDFLGVEYTETGIYDIYLPVEEHCDKYYELTLEVIPPLETFLEEEICVNTSFEIGGESFTEEGAYSLIFLSENTACDSIVYLNLSVVGTTEVTQRLENICFGEEYLIGEDTLRISGNYFYEFIDINGCDSLVDLTLEVLPTPEAMVTATICSGECYPFNGADYSVEGTYTTNILLPSGCDSMLTLQLTVLPNDTTRLSAQICDGQAFLVGPESYTTSGRFETSLMAANGCDSLIILDLQVLDPILTVDSISICQGDSLEILGNTYREAGSYDFPFPQTAGCDSIYRVVLELIAPLTQTFNPTICVNEVFSLGSETFDSTGTYLVTTPAPNGCDSVYTINLMVLDNLTSREDLFLCAGESYSFADSILTTSGIYEFILLSQDGCDSLLSIHLEVANPIVNNLEASICRGTSFMVGDELFDTTGIYNIPLLSADGCDSTLVLDLLVVDFYETYLTASLCVGESYAVGDSIYALSGNYQNELIATDGCDSIVNLDLEVHPLLDTLLTRHICAEDSMWIAGQAYSATGIYQQTVPSVITGCDSTIVLDLTVNTPINVDLTEEICVGNSIIVGNSIYSSTGLYADTLRSAALGCDSVVHLDLTVYPIAETFLEEAVCEDESFTVGSEIYDTSGDFTTVLHSLTTGCDSIVYLNLTVNEPALTQVEEQICTEDSFEMGGVFYTETGIYQADLMTSLGCDSTVVLDLYVAPCNLMFFSEVSDNTCFGESAGTISFRVLEGTPPYNYSWQGNENNLNGTGTITTNEEFVYLSNLPADNYTINVTDANAVVATFFTSVAEPPPLQLELIVSDYGGFQLSCASSADGFISANASGGMPPYRFEWSNGATAASIKDLTAGAYTLVVFDANNCRGSATTIIQAPNLLVGNLAANSPLCADDQFGIISVSAVSGGLSPYLFALDEGTYSPIGLFPTVSIGEHIVHVQDANGCEWELEAVIEPAPELSVDLGEDIELVYGDSIRLIATSTDHLVGYQWMGGAALSCDTCASPLVQPQETSIYSVEATNEKGCTAEDAVTVFVRKQYDVFIPNAFSPDGDNINDRFNIYGSKQVQEIKSLKIFNRWGNMIYEAERLLAGEEDRGWDGQLQGQLLPAGIYVYVAEIHFLDGTNKIYRGEVMLMR